MDSVNWETVTMAVLACIVAFAVWKVVAKVIAAISTIIAIVVVLGITTVGVMVLPDIGARNPETLAELAAKASLPPTAGHTAAGWCQRFVTWRDNLLHHALPF